MLCVGLGMGLTLGGVLVCAGICCGGNGLRVRLTRMGPRLCPRWCLGLGRELTEMVNGCGRLWSSLTGER